MKKQSSYQKLKAENEQLKQDIYKMVMEPEKIETLMTIERYRLRFETIDAIMSGSRDRGPLFTGGGIIDMLTNAPILTESENNEPSFEMNNDKESVIKFIEETFKSIAETIPKQRVLKTGKLLIDLLEKGFTPTVNNKYFNKNSEYHFCYGMTIQKINYYPDNFFTYDDKMCWIEGGVIKVKTVPGLTLNSKISFNR